MFRYRRHISWNAPGAFPRNAGYVARERISIRHYPHRDPEQMERRHRLRAGMLKLNGGPFAHWKLEDQINDLLKMVSQLLEDGEKFLVLNTYSLGFSSLIIENLMNDIFKLSNKADIGEIYLQSRTNQKLPLGVFGRFCELQP